MTEAQAVQGKAKAADAQQVVEAREGVPSDEELEEMLRPEEVDAAQVLRKGRVEYLILEEDSLGTIIDARYQKRLLAQNDIVYLAMKERAPQIGERFMIFRTMKKLRNPYTREKTKKIYVLGALTVKAIKGAFYQAEITDSFDAIWRGDEIMTYREVQ